MIATSSQPSLPKLSRICLAAWVRTGAVRYSHCRVMDLTLVIPATVVIMGLHIVTGKGGVGKTTVALALADALAACGDRVLVCEVEGRFSIAEAASFRSAKTGEEQALPGHPGVWLLGVDARQALQEYLRTHFRLGLAGKALDRAGFVDFATMIAPGLRDVLLLGKVYEAAHRQSKTGRDYDAVILDAPPTGRVVRFLTATDALGEVAKVGPTHDQAERVAAFLRREGVVHLVTTLAEMPITETIETIAELRTHGLPRGALILNRVPPQVPAGEVDDPPLATYLAWARRRREQADAERAELPSLEPVAELPEVLLDRAGWATLATAVAEVAKIGRRC